MITLYIALGAMVATLLGGAVALYLKDKLHLITGFAAGAVIGVAFFDLLPEAIELGQKSHGVEQILTVSAIGFLVYLLLDRFVFSHCHNDHQCDNKEHRGHFGALSLIIHSFFDGLTIGLAFQISTVIGAIVTVAVLTHDFSDGINTVSLILRQGGARREAFKWLLADALAPALGILTTVFFVLPVGAFGFILSLFAGFFLYLGASDLLPESHHAHPTGWTTVATLAGVIVIYLTTLAA